MRSIDGGKLALRPYPLAAIVGDPACSRDPDLAHDVNLEATKQLLDDVQSAGIERLVFAST